MSFSKLLGSIPLEVVLTLIAEVPKVRVFPFAFLFLKPLFRHFPSLLGGLCIRKMIYRLSFLGL